MHCVITSTPNCSIQTFSWTPYKITIDNDINKQMIMIFIFINKYSSILPAKNGSYIESKKVLDVLIIMQSLCMYILCYNKDRNNINCSVLFSLLYICYPYIGIHFAISKTSKNYIPRNIQWFYSSAISC